MDLVSPFRRKFAEFDCTYSTLWGADPAPQVVPIFLKPVSLMKILIVPAGLQKVQLPGVSFGVKRGKFEDELVPGMVRISLQIRLAIEAIQGGLGVFKCLNRGRTGRKVGGRIAYPDKGALEIVRNLFPLQACHKELVSARNVGGNFNRRLARRERLPVVFVIRNRGKGSFEAGAGSVVRIAKLTNSGQRFV